MKIKLTKLQTTLIVLLLFVLINYLFGSKSQTISIIYAALLMILCLINMYRSKNNILGFIFHLELFYYNYSVVFSRYLHIANEFHAFYKNASIQVLNIGITCLLIFEIIMTFCYSDSKIFKEKYLYAENKNVYISLALLLVAFIIGITCFDWNNYGNRFSITPYYEYIGILLILGLHYSGYNKGKIIKYGYSILIFSLILQGLIYGERISALQFFFIWLFYFRGEKLKSKNVIIISLIGIFGMTLVSAYRSTYSISAMDVAAIWNNLRDRLLTFNGADLGYYCSLTFIMVAQKVENSTRVGMFIKFLYSIIVGNSNEANLAVFTRQYYSHWYGGFYPLFFYFYGGMKLVVIMSYVWCRIVCKCIKENAGKYGKYLYLLGLYLVCIAARWYMYTPLNAFRPTLLFTIAYFALKYFNAFFYKKREIYEEN